MSDWPFVIALGIVLAFVYGMAYVALRFYEVREHHRWSPHSMADMIGGKRRIDEVD